MNNPPADQPKKKKKKLSKKNKLKLAEVRAINKQRACFRTWVYYRNRGYVIAAVVYVIYWMYNYHLEHQPKIDIKTAFNTTRR